MRKAVILSFLVFGSVLIAVNSNICVSGKSCEKEYNDYITAENVYYTARIAYFNGVPNTCADLCKGTSNPTACTNECISSRRTALAEAEIDLFSTALDTCTPYSIAECEAARGQAEPCLSQFDYPGFSDPDEALAVYQEYSACRLPTKVDSCQ